MLLNTNEIKTLASDKARIFYYPSCGYKNISQDMFNLDADLFIFSDYRFKPGDLTDWCWQKFTKQIGIVGFDRYSNSYKFSLSNSNKTGLLICDTNDKCIELLKSSGIKLSYLIGVNDGCNEGGNLNCNNTKEWFEKINELIGEHMIYITDHFKDIAYSHYQSIPDFPEKILLPEKLVYKPLDVIPENEVMESKYPFPPDFYINQETKQKVLAVYSIQNKPVEAV